MLDGKPYRSRQHAQLRGHQPSVLAEQSVFQRGAGALGVTDDGEAEEPPSERIAAYVAALLERWCDTTEDEEGTSPWSSGRDEFPWLCIGDLGGAGMEARS